MEDSEKILNNLDLTRELKNIVEHECESDRNCSSGT